MTKKLTKNVSMCDSHAAGKKNDLKKRINLRNATKAFEMVLAKHDSRDAFVKNWAKQNLLSNEGVTFATWKKVRKCYKVWNWVSRSFVWSLTPEGYDFWKKINEDWEKWVYQYITSSNESRSN